MSRTGVLHLIDTLSPGGAERMCVQLANALPSGQFAAHVCATRRAGPLAKEIAPHVGFLDLRRRGRFDPLAVWRLRRYIQRHGIRILHAHGTSAFLAVAVRAVTPGLKVYWHDHYGARSELRGAPAPYRLLRAGLDGAIVVNERLRAWAREKLGLAQERVWLLPNFPAQAPDAACGALPGEPPFRIVQIANLRPDKDHLMMLRALRRIADEEPRVHLLLAGEAGEDEYARSVRAQIQRDDLASHVTLLGLREDVPALLRQCALGVLSSRSEGLPLALLEYGEAGLAVVCTAVGDCPAVLAPLGGGCLVPAGDSAAMAQAALALLKDEKRRREQGAKLQRTVRERYSQEAAIRTVTEIYAHAIA